MSTCFSHLTIIRPPLQNLEKGTCSELQVPYKKKARIKLLLIIHNTNHNSTVPWLGDLLFTVHRTGDQYFDTSLFRHARETGCSFPSLLPLFKPWTYVKFAALPFSWRTATRTVGSSKFSFGQHGQNYVLVKRHDAFKRILAFCSGNMYYYSVLCVSSGLQQVIGFVRGQFVTVNSG
jgi:hypothetical protein